MQDMSSNSASNTPTARHLDIEYRRRWETYTTPDQVYDSRQINWRDVPWKDVTKLQASVRDHEYTVDNTGPKFKSFIRWRWGGFDAGRTINTWCIGWTDGKTCFMKEIDFKTGDMVEKEYPLKQFHKHLEGVVNIEMSEIK